MGSPVQLVVNDVGPCRPIRHPIVPDEIAASEAHRQRISAEQVPDLSRPLCVHVEVRLVQLWESLLGVRGIGPTQDFFDLGGDSFLALHLFARVNRAFGADVPVRGQEETVELEPVRS